MSLEHYKTDEELDTEDREIGDEEVQDPEPQKKPKVSERRHAQNAKFSSWANDIATQVPIKAVTQNQNDEMLSLRQLMARQESQVIIGSPRDYQVELFERAKVQNTIAVLPTGSGKTLISVLLLRHVIDQELEDRALGKPRRISFFLVEKVTLVFQQFAVLQCNLDQKIEHFCGAMGSDLWVKETWVQYFSKNMVIVCTADVLLQCLQHSFITIEQINLLIFDEAHHAKKKHAYAKIIKEFYLDQTDPTKRPRIFGMTASPVDVDAADDLEGKARELETLLHSQIATTSDLTLLHNSVHKPTDQVIRFDRLRFPFETLLYHELWARYSHLQDFRGLFDHAKSIAAELGQWCSDAYWSFAFAERQAKKIEAKVEKRFYLAKKQKLAKDLDAEIASLRAAQEEIASHDFGKPNTNTSDLSTKVIKLHQILQLYFERPSDTRCLVFVEKRYTARLLEIVFNHIGGEYLRAGSLVGATALGADSQKTSFKQQVFTLVKFRKGTLNCLFATSVAEEGLDIQDCNLVIRFDPAKTMIQNVQSRGRARHKNSKFIHLVEYGNLTQEETLQRVGKAEILMQNFCGLLPRDRLLRTTDVDLDGLLVKERDQRTYKEKTTGAKLTYDFSLVVLAHFVGCLPHGDEDDMSINYVISVREGKYECEVILPVRSPIVTAKGRLYANKSTAKRSAAFQMCIELRQKKYLDANLLPTYAKQLPAMRNALLALNSKKSNEYRMLLKPSCWKQDRGSFPSNLFLTVITLDGPWDRPLSPIGLLTRHSLPLLPKFPLYRITGQSSNVVTVSLTKTFEVDSILIEQLTGFTLRILKDIFNKKYEHDASKMSYWLAPLLDLPADMPINYDSPQELIDWTTVTLVQALEPEQWMPDMPIESLLDKFFIDNWDGGRRFFTVSVAANLKATDPVPPHTVQAHRADNIIAYSVSLWKKSRQRRHWNENQPVLEAEKILHRLNVLADPSPEEQSALTKCFICPEPLSISRLPIGLVSMVLLFPAIINRIESYLISLEFCTELGLDIDVKYALEAVTKDSDNTDDMHGERVNFQRGMGANYERLEFIGDCFLKMATSISLFVKFASNDEYAMHVDRMLMICNKNMFENSKQAEWYRYVRGLGFSRRTWYPQGMILLEGKGAKQEQPEFGSQHLADKTIADVCEAMIGAAYVTHVKSGYHAVSQFDNAVKAVTAFVRSPNHAQACWREYYEAYSLPKYQVAECTASQRDLAAHMEMKHSYHFSYPRLLQSAFLHPSYPRNWEHIPSYQRLEFLGDSLLDMASVQHLFDLFPTKDPQWLTEHKMAMVSNKFFGALCVKMEFHRHLRHNSSVIQHQIKMFIEEIEELEEECQGCLSYWTLAKDPPKCLPDIIESYVGAIFVDSGFSYPEVQRFFDTHIAPFFVDMSIYDAFASNHPITKLHQLLSISLGCRNYRLMAQEMPSEDGLSTICLAGLMVHDTVMSQGRAASSKVAKIHASADALATLQGIAPVEFRVRYGCDCAGGEEGEVGTEDLVEMVGTAI